MNRLFSLLSLTAALLLAAEAQQAQPGSLPGSLPGAAAAGNNQILALPTGPENPYCKPQMCARGRSHVACEKYTTPYHKSCLTAEPKMVNLTVHADLILRLHNEQRQRVASGKNSSLPRSARMVVMQWNEELATLAGYNARMCQAKHDDCRNTQNFTRSGQNIIVFNMTHRVEDELLERLYPELLGIGVRTWWGEHANMTAADMEHYPCDPKRQQLHRHFAVMAMESNSHVGCAGDRYVTKGLTHFKLTCNYARDPVCGQPIYRIRTEGCLTGRNKQYPALCSTNEVFT
ncbi:antigen 5 like allergen Cul n 1-like [Drosophila pseudoobscura]|uniref:Antigen 5 like allergen Cul n 1-like n=2 Tax=pseudoobscura subgroup TaxID=32358 RepID=A0A6I8V0H0_DROPS|nr:antigen 5 like allergen Cul n 1 [Drosophila pseudoobscura]